MNCDEQYLPGALQAAVEYFQRHPSVDLLFADALIVDGAGQFLCFRKVQAPHKYHTWLSHLQTFTCSMFFRRNIIDKHKIFFDPKWRSAGDADALRLLEARVKMGVLRRFTSAFTDTGVNLNISPKAKQEEQEMRNAVAWARRAKLLLVWQHRLRRLFGGVYRQKPFDFAIYTQRSRTNGCSSTWPIPPSSGKAGSNASSSDAPLRPREKFDKRPPDRLSETCSSVKLKRMPKCFSTAVMIRDMIERVPVLDLLGGGFHLQLDGRVAQGGADHLVDFFQERRRLFLACVIPPE